MRRTIGLFAAVMVVLAGCGWAHPRFDTGKTGANPFETTISAANVASLSRQFVAGSTPDVIPSFVVARGHLSVSGPQIRVFDAAGVDGCTTGTPRLCSPQWTLDGGGSPDVYDGTLYRGGNAYDADGHVNCSGTPKVCTQVWQEGVGDAPPGPTDPAKLHLQGHKSYSGPGGSETVSLYGYDTACPPAPADCPLRWAGALGGGGKAGGAIGGPVVEGGRVFGSYRPVTSQTGTLFAFDGTDGTAPVLWTASTAGGVYAVGEGVVLTVNPVYIGSIDVGSQLVAYDAAGVTNCSGSPVVCQPLWFSDVWTGGGSEAPPAIVNGTVYRAVGDQLRAYDLHGNTNCSGVPKVCQKLWVGGTGAGINAPAVAGGLVFASDATGHVKAFDAAGFTGCSATTRVCGPLWDANVGGAVGAPEVAGGRVYVPAVDGNVHVFGLPG